MPFSHAVSAEPFLERAIQRVGHPPETRGMAEFYSYFSEIWGGDYGAAQKLQYAAYLPHLRPLPSGIFLDMGCGAGEFVEFLNQQGIVAEGVDQDSQEIERAVARGLSVFRGNVVEFLHTTTNRYAGFSMLEVIEHLPPDRLPELLQGIYDHLLPGGVVLMETVNIKHPIAFHSFYTDPTHQRPVPSDLLSFLLQWHGFEDCKVIYTSPLAYNLSQRHDAGRAYFNYAVIARKPLN